MTNIRVKISESLEEALNCYELLRSRKLDKCTDKEVKLMKNAGVYLEDKDYSSEELKRIEHNITEYIMNHSSKDGSIGRLQNEYDSIYRTLNIE